MSNGSGKGVEIVKWIAVTVTIMAVVGGATYQHASAVEQISSLKRDVARIEQGQQRQAQAMEDLAQRQAKAMEDLTRAVWTMQSRYHEGS